MAYTATNDVNDIDATKPLGSESPSVLDDVDRETRLTFKTVIKNALTSKGAQRIAIWKQVATAAVPSGTVVDQWNRRALATLNDPTSLLGVGDFTNSVKPIAGTYIVRFWGVGYKLDQFMTRIAQATGNTTGPSAATALTDLYGNAGFSNNLDAVMAQSSGAGLITTDGTKNYCLDQIHQTNNNTDGYGKAARVGWATSNANQVAVVEFDFLGILVP